MTNRVSLPAMATGHDGGPYPNDVWVHVRSRREYRVLGIAADYVTLTPSVLYQLVTDRTSVVWSMPVKDWFIETSPGKPRLELVSQGHKP